MAAGDMSLMGMGETTRWTFTTFGLMLLMWWVMMVGMMVPSAAPMILLFAAISRGKNPGDNPVQPIAIFITTYLITWLFFSVLATLAQWALSESFLLSPMMVTSSKALTISLLVACGIYQLTPLKHACLRKCRSPLSFLMTRWQPGNLGAVKMGFSHGAYCLGCCWLLMALLFVGGVMNLLWVALIAGLVLAEKVLPRGELLGSLSGFMMLIVAAYMVLPVGLLT